MARVLISRMWVWTWDEPVIIVYSIDPSDGKIVFHSITVVEGPE